jgi:hypothetical protein
MVGLELMQEVDGYQIAIPTTTVIQRRNKLNRAKVLSDASEGLYRY